MNNIIKEASHGALYGEDLAWKASSHKCISNDRQSHQVGSMDALGQSHLLLNFNLIDAATKGPVDAIDIGNSRARGEGREDVVVVSKKIDRIHHDDMVKRLVM